MLKRFLAAAFAALLIFAVGCGDGTVYEDLSDYQTMPNEEVEPDLSVNPLTGVKEFDNDETAKQRPVAIMVNNVNVAQSVQTGLSKADIIYETEVEGGITRLMAVFQDVTSAEKVGSVRSARYPYVDLAMGHNAIYVHCGQDPTYCKPHLDDIDDLDIDTNSKGAKRIPNGLSSEHTLYAITSDLMENITSKFDIKVKSVKNWANFTDDKLTLSGGAATTVTVPFPAMKSKFVYDSATGLYTRYAGDTLLKDYNTKEATTVKNVFVLMTSISNYPDGVHRKVALESGEGYYVTNGTYTAIKWKKGAADNSFKFTDESGAEIKVSAGNSWVCIADKSTSAPVME